MGFDIKNIDHAGIGAGGAPKLATYRTTDAKAVVQAAGYFNSVALSYDTGDALLIIASDVTKIVTLTVDRTLLTVALDEELLFGVLT